MLLDSANSQHHDSRFDIMVAAPLATIEYIQGETRLTDCQTNEITSSKDDPFHCLQQAMKDYLPDYDTSCEHSHLPFIAGALGYFGYDLARTLEPLPKQAINPYQTADMGVGIYAWSLIHDNSDNSFYLCTLPGLAHPSAAKLRQQLSNPLSAKKFHLTSDWQANVTAQQYQEKLDKIYQYLCAGDCYQVNFAQRFQSHYQGDEWTAYQLLREANQAPFSAFIRLANSCILSISPERFLALKQGKVETKPIKGTRPRSPQIDEDNRLKQQLLHSAKDRAENLMIVDLLRNDLSKSCLPGSVEVPALFSIDSFAAVHHMVSTVQGELAPEQTAFSLLRGAFPGGSITGAPKIRAMEIIDELEPHRRNIYCGSIAYVGIRNDMDSSICIRTLLAEQNNLYCWAGGGIVLDSEANDEYQESLDKVSKILPSLAAMHE